MRLSTFIIVLCSSIMLSACALGPRPTLVEDLPVGDANIVSLLDIFALVDSAEFTASYRINVNYGNTAATATVTQGEQERSITIGDTRYLIETDRTRTCDLASSSCSQGLDDTKVSDLQVTHQFWSRATEQRLRIDASRNIGPSEAYLAEFADTQVNCVSVPVVGGTKVYCATDEGVLAHYAGPDLLIELTDYSTTVNRELFSIGGT